MTDEELSPVFSAICLRSSIMRSWGPMASDRRGISPPLLRISGRVTRPLGIGTSAEDNFRPICSPCSVLLVVAAKERHQPTGDHWNQCCPGDCYSIVARLVPASQVLGTSTPYLPILCAMGVGPPYHTTLTSCWTRFQESPFRT